MSARDTDNQRLLARIREHHAASDGVMGMPRMREVLTEEGETASRNRIARLMASDGLHGIPQRRRWRRKRSGIRPAYVRNHLERDFKAVKPNTKWVTDITYIRTAEAWLYLCVVIDLYGGKVVGWSMSRTQDRQLVLKSRTDGLLAAPRSRVSDPALGSRDAVHVLRVPAVPEGSSPHAEHERRWPLR
jgi:putative transposase